MNRLQKISMLSLSLLLGGIPMKADDNVVNNVRLGAVRGRVVDNAQQVLPGVHLLMRWEPAISTIATTMPSTTWM